MLGLHQHRVSIYSTEQNKGVSFAQNQNLSRQGYHAFQQDFNRVVEQCASIVEDVCVLARRKGMIEIMLSRLLNTSQFDGIETHEYPYQNFLVHYKNKLSACESFDEDFFKNILGINGSACCIHGFDVVPQITPGVQEKIRAQVFSKLHFMVSEGIAPTQIGTSQMLRFMGSSALEALQATNSIVFSQNSESKISTSEVRNSQSTYDDAEQPSTSENQNGQLFLILFVGDEAPMLRQYMEINGAQIGSVIYLQQHRLGVRIKGCFSEEIIPHSQAAELYGIPYNMLFS